LPKYVNSWLALRINILFVFVMFFVFLMVIIVKQQVDKVLLSMTVIYIVSIQFALSDMFMNIGYMH